MKRKIPLWLALLLVILVGAAAGATGAILGFRDGAGEGLVEGERRAKVAAAREPPIVTVDRNVSADAILTPEVRATVGEMTDADVAPLVRILNRAPSSCYRLASRGVSLASSLVAAKSSSGYCETAISQVRLGLLAWRTFKDEQEAIAVLKLERRRPVNTAGKDKRGTANAPVTIVEWADYQCPYCVRTHGLMNKLIERDDVNFVFKHLPLSFHAAARPAAYALEAAARQGKRWEMHDELFELGKRIGDGIDKKAPLPASGPVPFEAQAQTLGLDLKQFRTDVRDPAIKKIVDDDIAEAKAMGVSSTPTFFVNDRRVVEGRSLKSFNRLIERAKAESVDGLFSWGMDDVPGPKKIPTEDEARAAAQKLAPAPTPTAPKSAGAK